MISAMEPRKRLRILGTRGIPARHGGFETFAEQLALYLVEKGWEVVVYCQTEGLGPIRESQWKGVRLIHIPVNSGGPAGTIVFDWKSTLHAARERALTLTLGYNTAIFCALYRVRGIPNLINMDGIEWRRRKWPWPARAWFYLNERMGCWLGDHLIADHPLIRTHLETRIRKDKITLIPYGAEEVTEADPAPLRAYGLEPGRYALLVARPEPENSILEIVRAFSARPRGIRLVLIGNYDSKESAFQRAVVDAAGDEVLFPGAIYDKPIVQALRYHALLYIHGHRVGGTNPSLVEALGAGCAVLAHANEFNRWVAGSGARYFTDQEDCARELDELLGDPSQCLRMKEASRIRFGGRFELQRMLLDYETLLMGWLPG